MYGSSFFPTESVVFSFLFEITSPLPKRNLFKCLSDLSWSLITLNQSGGLFFRGLGLLPLIVIMPIFYIHRFKYVWKFIFSYRICSFFLFIWRLPVLCRSVISLMLLRPLLVIDHTKFVWGFFGRGLGLLPLTVIKPPFLHTWL